MNIVTVMITDNSGCLNDIWIFKTNRPQSEICSLDYEPTEYMKSFLAKKLLDIEHYNVEIFYYHNDSLEEI